MANLLFCDLRRRGWERKFRTGAPLEINDITDEGLHARSRFRWESILFITNLIAGDINRNTRRNHVPSPLHQLSISPRFYGSGGFLQVLRDTFGVDKFIVSRAITGIIGCVDGTHVTFHAPTQNENNYVNRKGLHPSNVQGVCNHGDEWTFFYSMHIFRFFSHLYTFILSAVLLRCRQHPQCYTIFNYFLVHDAVRKFALNNGEVFLNFFR